MRKVDEAIHERWARATRWVGRALLLLCWMPATTLAEIPPPHFGPRPRLHYLQHELDAWPDQRRQQQLQQADKIVERGLDISDQEGQWIFYYACPADNSSLRAESSERHVCPRCGKVYSDERTIAAWQTTRHYQLDQDIGILALAYALSHDGRYAAAARQGLLEIARIWPTLTRHDRWGRRGILAVVGGRRYVQHLDEAGSLIDLARAYDLVADSPLFSAADRQAVEQYMRRVCGEIQSKAWLMEPRNNHQTWFNAAYANVAVAIGDTALLHAAIYAPNSGMLWQMEHSVTSDGIWFEGTMAYHFYALQALRDTLQAAARAGWHFADNAALKSLWMGPLQLAYPNGSFPVINDSDPGNLRGHNPFYDFAAAYFNEPSFREFDQPRELESTLLAGAGLAVLRRGGPGGAKALFLDFGIHGGHHGHPDKLNIMLYALGRELILDPGRLTYSVPEHLSWARTTVAHNTIVINQKDQEPDEGEILWYIKRDDYSAVAAVSSGASRGYTLRRALLLCDEWLLDICEAEGSKKATIDLLLHLRGQMEEKGEVWQGELGRANGYQHLREIVRHAAAQESCTMVQPDKRKVKVHHWPRDDFWSGNGIGYSLNDKVPFILRRQSGTAAAFVTLYDLNECGISLGAVEREGEKYRVELLQGDGKRVVELLLGKSEAASAVSMQR